MTTSIKRRTAVLSAVTAFVLVLSLWPAGSSRAARGATPRVAAAVTLPATAPITEVGPLNAASYGNPLAVDDRGDVLYLGTVTYNSASGPTGQPGGIWHDGAFVPAPTPSGAVDALPVDMNSDGLVVGGATLPVSGVTASSPGFVGVDGYYWDTVTGDASLSPVVAPTAGCAEEAGSLVTVDDTGEAAGSEGSIGDDPDCGSNVVAAGLGDPMEPVSGTPYIEAIQPDWELVDPDGGANYTDWSRVDRSDGSVTPIPFAPTGGDGAAIQNALAPDGSVVGSAPGGGVPEIMLPDGTVQALPAPAGDSGEAEAINDSGEIVGEIKGRGVLWTSFTAQPINLNAILPLNSGWVLGSGIAISGEGNVLGFGTLNGSPATYLLRTGQTKVAGNVNNIECGATGCQAPTPLPGVTIVLSGTSSDGLPVGSSTISKADGTWTAYVPPGTYSIGPSQDGTTIDGAGFDPEQADNVTVGSTAVTGPNFSACADETAGAGSAGDRRSLRYGAAAAPASTPFVSLCKSVYTFTVSAKIPEPVLADPALTARYNTAGTSTQPGYNSGVSFHFPSTFAHKLGHEYPSCLKPAEVKAFNAGGNNLAIWYSEIEGNTSLGSITVPIVWNQSTQEAKVEAAPTITRVPLTRVWYYKLSFRNQKKQVTRVVKDHCDTTVDSIVQTDAVGGGDEPTSQPLNQATILAAWGFPFEASGALVSPRTSLVERSLRVLAAEGHDLYAGFKGLPELVQFGAEFLIKYALGDGLVAVAAKGAAQAEKFATIAKYLPGVAARLPFVGAAGKQLHGLHSIYEILEYLAGALGEPELGEGDLGSYPIMGAVIRVSFHVNKYLPVTTPKGPMLTQQTQVAVSVASTRFPTIALHITRDALPDTPSSGASTGTVFTGKELPWATAVFGDPAVWNNAFTAGANVIADASTTGHYYASGEAAVRQIHTDTDQLPAITEGVRDGWIGDKFATAITEGPDPSCNANNTPASNKTICWLFDDERP